MKRKLAAVVMTLVLLLGLPFRAFAQETTQPTQTAQTTETQPGGNPTGGNPTHRNPGNHFHLHCGGSGGTGGKLLPGYLVFG